MTQELLTLRLKNLQENIHNLTDLIRELRNNRDILDDATQYLHKKQLEQQIKSREETLAAYQKEYQEIQAQLDQLSSPIEPMPPKPKTPNIAELFNLLDDAFNDGDLQTFCMKYFEKVYNNFALGQSKNARIQALLDYCKQHLEYDKLLHQIKEERPAMYQVYQARLFT